MFAGVLLAVSACSSDGSTTEPTDTTRSTTATPTTSPGATTSTVPASGRPQGFAARLEFFGDCPALLSYMQTEAAERVTAWGLGGGPFYYGDDRAMVDEMAEADTAATAAPDAGIPATGSYSGTNTQEVGVDEGDIVETDGRFVYVANADGLRIVSVTDAEVVAEPELPQGSHQLLLDGQRLLVVTSSWSGSPDTIVSLYDVADPTNPSLLRRSHLEGNVDRDPFDRRGGSPGDLLDVRSAAAVRPAEPVRPGRGIGPGPEPGDHRRLERRGLAPPVVRRGR